MKTAFITGGTGGIGTAIVEKLFEKGYQIAVGYHSRKEEAESLAQKTGGRAYAVSMDDFASFPNLIRQIVLDFGSLDLLVNNAGISLTGLFTECNPQAIDLLYAVNLRGPIELSREASKVFVSQHSGTIINITSMWGEVGASCEVDYSATKAGLSGFTKALARELGPSGIRVNAIAPGVIDTEMNAHLSSEDLDALREETALCRLGLPDDIANAVVFLASDQSDFITGQILRVDGAII